MPIWQFDYGAEQNWKKYSHCSPLSGENKESQNVVNKSISTFLVYPKAENPILHFLSIGSYDTFAIGVVLFI